MNFSKKLTPEDQLYFWRTRTGAEVDVIWRRNGKLIPVEVKFNLSEKDPVPSGLRSFITRYFPEFALVLGNGVVKRKNVNPTTVLYYPCWMV